MTAETISDIFTDFQNSAEGRPSSCRKLAPRGERAPGAGPGRDERASKLYARDDRDRDDEEDDEPGERQAEQARRRQVEPRSTAVCAARRRRRGFGLAGHRRTSGYPSGRLHLFPHLRVDIAPWDVAVDVRVARPEGVRVVDLQSTQEIARRRLAREGSRVRSRSCPLATSPLAVELQASANACASLGRGESLSSMSMPTQASGFSFGMHVDDREAGLGFFLICTQSLGQAYAIQRSPEPKASQSVGLGRPDHPHEMLLRDEELLRPA